jgi:hypothetical protein
VAKGDIAGAQLVVRAAGLDQHAVTHPQAAACRIINNVQSVDADAGEARDDAADASATQAAILASFVADPGTAQAAVSLPPGWRRAVIRADTAQRR